MAGLSPRASRSRVILRRPAHVRLDHGVVDHVVLRRTRFRGQQKLVEAVVHARDFARALAAHQLDALHGRGEPLVIAQVAAQAHEILGEAQGHRARFLARILAAASWPAPRCAPGKSPAPEIASGFPPRARTPRAKPAPFSVAASGWAGNNRGRCCAAGSWPARGSANPRSSSRASQSSSSRARVRRLAVGAAGPLGVEQAARVLRLVQIVAQDAV